MQGSVSSKQVLRGRFQFKGIMNKNEKFIMSLIEDGVFSIDDQGRIWRHKARYSRHNDYKFIKTQRAEYINSGYYEISVSYRGKKYRTKAHRIVWIYFHDDINNNLTINHKNLIKTDNSLDNLELLTSSANTSHAAQNMPWGANPGEQHHNNKLTEKDIIAIRKEFALGKISINKLAEKYRISSGQMGRIVSGKRWKYLTNGKPLQTKYGAAKLTEDQVLEIRDKHIKGKHLEELAEEYLVLKCTIKKIVERKSWKHI